MLEKECFMRERKSNYMSQLDDWTLNNVINPLLGSEPNDLVVAGVMKAIREKTLESYRNGQESKPALKGRAWKK